MRLARRRDPLRDVRVYRPHGPPRYPASGPMSTLSQHGAAIASPPLAGAGSPVNGGLVTLVEAALSLAIVLALAILWWRTLRPGSASGRGGARA